MADNLNLELKISADDTASPALQNLNEQLDQSHAELEKLQQSVPKSAKDWADYAENTSKIASNAAEAGDSLASLRLHMLEASAASSTIAAATAVIAKWKTIVEGVAGAYDQLKKAVADAGQFAAESAQSGWTSVQTRTEALEVKIGQLTARFLEFGRIASALETAGIVLAIAEIGIKADESNEKTRQLTEQIGGLKAALQSLDPASSTVQAAKERFEELYKASLNLGAPIDDLLPKFKAFFEQTDKGDLSTRTASAALTDFLNVQKSLAASATETAEAQKNVAAAFESGSVSVSQLGAIFGSALNPALDAVAHQMGVTRDELKNLIDTGKVGTEAVFPALAAAARTVTAPLSGAGEAAAFSRQQFDAMGLSVYELSSSKLPGVTTALQYTQKAIAATVDAAVDPIGAAVEQIENFGTRISEWGRLTRQSIADAFAGPEIVKAFKGGLQESIYDLDLILVSARSAIQAAGESLGILAGAATTATNPLAALNEAWLKSADEINHAKTQLQGYIDALEGVDNASGRTAEASKALAEAAKGLPAIHLPEALQEIVDKLTATQTASSQVGAVWKQLQDLNFTGDNIKSLLILRQTIEDVSAKTGDAAGTQVAFARELASLPTKQFEALLEKTTALKSRLEEAGDKGALFGTVISVAFDKTLDAARKAAAQAEVYNKTQEGILALGEKRALNAQLIANSLNSEAAALQTATEKANAEAVSLQAAAQTAAVHAQAAQALADGKQAQADASQEVFAKLQQETAGVASLFEAENQGLAAAKADAEQKSNLAAQSREVAAAAQLEAAQAAGVAQAHQLSAQGASVLLGSLNDLRQNYENAAAKAEVLAQNERDGIATHEQTNTAIAGQIQALAAYNSAVRLTQTAFRGLGLDVEQVLTGMDAKFRETIQNLRDLASSGKLTGTSLREALQNAINTADTRAELQALEELLKRLGVSGKLSAGEVTHALDAVQDKLLQVRGATDPVAQAFRQLGIQSHESLNRAAEDARHAFETIRDSGTATPADIAAAFDAMAAKIKTASQDSADAIDRQSAAQERARARAIAWAAVRREEAAHDAAVHAEEMRMVAEASAAAQQRRIDDAATIHDGETVHQVWDMATASLLAYGYKGMEALQNISRAIGGAGASWDLYFELANRWTEQAAKQEDEVRRLTTALQEAAQSGIGLSSAMAAANQNFDKLDANRMVGLQQAIESARQKMQALQDSAKSTLQTLQQEFIQLTGNAKQQEDFQYHQKKLELEKQLQAARNAGNAKAINDLQQAEALEYRIHRQKLANIRVEEQAKAGGGSFNAPAFGRRALAQESIGAMPASSQAIAGSEKTIHVRLAGADGQAVSLFTQAGNEQPLLNILQTARAVGNA
jgi:tape measure domain-containing protein